MTKVFHVAAVALLLATAGVAEARSGYLSDFNAKYGTAGTKLDSCDTCHVPGGHTRNPYGLDVEAKILAGQTAAAAITSVDPLDSDGDTYANGVEAMARTFPGDPSDKPGTTVTYCADADNDGYAVCTGTCVLPAGKVCGDCNDSLAAVNPGAVEGPFGSATCSDAIDNDCDGSKDSADSACVPPASDYDIVSVFAPAAALLKQPLAINVTIVNPGNVDPGATITILGSNGRKSFAVVTDQLFHVAAGQTATLSFTYTPTATGTITWTATVNDGDADVDQGTTTTSVTRK